MQNLLVARFSIMANGTGADVSSRRISRLCRLGNGTPIVDDDDDDDIDCLFLGRGCSPEANLLFDISAGVKSGEQWARAVAYFNRRCDGDDDDDDDESGCKSN